MDDYRTIKAACEGELEEKKSRFIASLMPVAGEEQATAHISAVKAANRKARHNVYAYILREGNISRYSDDGEPQGTGGVPVLEVLKGAGLTDVCVVVTRYFGGILLGTGGLARAYAGAVKNAVAAAEVLDMRRCSRFDIRCDYNLYSRLTRLLPELGAKVLSEEFADAVSLSVIVRADDIGVFREKVVNAANGRIDMEETKDLFENFA